jgi:hypothetical protein
MMSGIFLFFAPGFSQNSAIISWRPVTQDTSGALEEDPLYYNLFCDSIPAFVPSIYNFLAATTDTQYVHSDPRLADSTRHLFYMVQAVDFWGNHSAWSDTVGESSFVLARVKVLLQSPYSADGDSMSTFLVASGKMSLSSPYPKAPRRCTTLPNSMTDWIWLQLRHAETGEVAAQGSYLLGKDGRVTELDGGNEQLGFVGVTEGDYQFVIRHRNHLAVMARPLLHLSERGAALYDFTADSSAYWGGDAAAELEPGVWGLWIADLDQDGKISTADYDQWLLAAGAGREGYQVEDVNFDGQVTTRDYVIWRKIFDSGPSAKIP